MSVLIHQHHPASSSPSFYSFLAFIHIHLSLHLFFYNLEFSVPYLSFNMSGFFSNRVKLPVHLIQLVLVVGVLVVSVVRMLNQPKNAPRGRSTTMALGMVCIHSDKNRVRSLTASQAAKSLIIILYQVLSDHVRAFKKWSSLKAYVILNALEIVFWGAVVFMMIQANLQFCEGMSCTLSWIVVVMGIIMRYASNMNTVNKLD